MIYLEQMYTRFLNILTILQWTNTTLVISKCGTFPPFLFLVILFSVRPSNFIVSGVKSSK